MPFSLVEDELLFPLRVNLLFTSYDGCLPGGIVPDWSVVVIAVVAMGEGRKGGRDLGALDGLGEDLSGATLRK